MKLQSLFFIKIIHQFFFIIKNFLDLHGYFYY